MAKINIGDSLDEFYKTIEQRRNEYFNENKGEEPRRLRNIMVEYLLNNLKDEAICVDFMSGDAVVPLALLYLQRKLQIKKIKKIYAVDNDLDGAFDLMVENIKYFNLEDALVPVKKDVDDLSLLNDMQDAEVSLCIEVVNYVIHPVHYTVYSKEQFFKNLARQRECYILQVKKAASGLWNHFIENFMEEFKKYFLKITQKTLEEIDGNIVISAYAQSNASKPPPLSFSLF